MTTQQTETPTTADADAVTVTPNATDRAEVSRILSALDAWIKQQSRLDPRDYGLGQGGMERGQWKEARRAYMADARTIAKQGKEARGMLAIARATPPRLPLLLDAFHAFSGRLEWIHCTCKDHLNCPTCSGEKMVCANCNQCTRCSQHKVGCKGCPLQGGRSPYLSYTTGQYWPTEYRAAAFAVLTYYVRACQRAEMEENPRVHTFVSMDDVRAVNAEIGHCWFDRSTMRFFRTRIESTLIGGQYFVTSEQCSDAHRRLYSVRRAEPNGQIDTVGEFQQYGARKDALAAIRQLVRAQAEANV